MEKKEQKTFFFKALIITAFILLANIGVFFYKFGSNFTGYSVSEGILKSYNEISKTSKILLIAQWMAVLIVLVFIFVSDMGVRRKEIIDIKSKKIAEKSGTDLDTLYSVLQEKKKLRLSTIAKSFNVDEDIAMEWCKILESGNLAYIDYPGIGEPVIRLSK